MKLNVTSFFQFLIGFCLLTQTPGLCQQEITCEISVAGISIGQLNAKKLQTNGEEKYSLSSEVAFWFFGKVYVSYVIESLFLNGQFMHSQSKTSTTRGDFSSNIQWRNDHYDVKANNFKFENNNPIKSPMFFSTAKLYFEEPKNHDQFLAENFGLVSAITKKNDYYEVNVNGNINKFYYHEGAFVKAVMESPIKNYVIQKK